jgi:hypothetical protein
MPHIREESRGYWLKFVEHCEETGINMLHKEDWLAWWECWNAALDARDAEDMNKFGIQEEDEEGEFRGG